jgi:hypothetical protein
MPYGSVNADVITTSTAGGVLGAGNASIMKNRIINGAMVIDQRNAGASISNPSGYTLDRWNFSASQASKFTAQQNQGSVTPPTGFSNYLGLTSSSAYSIVAGDYFQLYQQIEGFNTADLMFGTASAKTVTLSFQVYSSLTGTFGGALVNSASNRSYPFTYTISSANTWTSISITIAGDTSGTWIGATNGVGLSVRFGLGVGSTYSGTAGAWASALYVSATGATSVVGTSGATFYITGVQLEVGSSATGFEYVNYQTSLANCQRYFQTYGNAADTVILPLASPPSAAELDCYMTLPVVMRTTPSLSSSGLKAIDGNTNFTTSASPTNYFSNASVIGFYLSGGWSGSLTAYRPYTLITTASGGYLRLSAEL